jgi:hypothetical protein
MLMLCCINEVRDDSFIHMKLLCTVSKIKCVGNRDIKLSIETGLNDCALIDNEANCVQWALDRKKQFTTKSLYRFLTDRG